MADVNRHCNHCNSMVRWRIYVRWLPDEEPTMMLVCEKHKTEWSKNVKFVKATRY